jgi:hypothetical protein
VPDADEAGCRCAYCARARPGTSAHSLGCERGSSPQAISTSGMPRAAPRLWRSRVGSNGSLPLLKNQ